MFADCTCVAPTAAATYDELIHTTAKHPLLTTDRGFVLAGTLQRGERVVREDGVPATVVAVVVRPSAAAYYNLTVSVLHTYAVGSGRYVVHNCTPQGRVANARARQLDRLLQQATGMADDAYKGKTTVAVGLLKNGKWIAALNEGAGDLAETFAPIVKQFGGDYVGPTAFVGAGKHAEAFILQYAGEDRGDLLGIGASNYLCEECTPLFDDAIRGTPGRNLDGSIRPVR